MVATGCDKAKEFVRAGQTSGPPQLSPGEELDLNGRPDVLFEVFGESGDPRMVPIAAIVGGKMKPIRLSVAGWHKFDEMYQRPGKSYSLYQSGIASGTVDVKRGMWSDTADALYALPGCATLTPMASVKVNGRLASDFTLEFLASTAAAMGKTRAGAAMNQDSVNRIARSIAHDVGEVRRHQRSEARLALLPRDGLLHGRERVADDHRVVHRCERRASGVDRDAHDAFSS